MADDDRLRAAAMLNPHARASLERSADAWTVRAKLLDRLEAGFRERIAMGTRSRTPAQ